VFESFPSRQESKTVEAPVLKMSNKSVSEGDDVVVVVVVELSLSSLLLGVGQSARERLRGGMDDR